MNRTLLLLQMRTQLEPTMLRALRLIVIHGSGNSI